MKKVKKKIMEIGGVSSLRGKKLLKIDRDKFERQNCYYYNFLKRNLMASEFGLYRVLPAWSLSLPRHRERVN